MFEKLLANSVLTGSFRVIAAILVVW